MKLKKLTGDLVLFLAFALFGVILWFAIPALIPGKSGFQIDSRLFPRVIAALIFIVGAASAGTAALKKQYEPAGDKEKEGKEAAPVRMSSVRVAIMAGLMLLYAFLMEPLGFIPATLLVTTALLVLQKVKKPAAYIAVYTACAAIYCIFHYILMVQLP